MIPDGEREHAAQARNQAIDAPGAVTFHQNFRVGTGAEAVAGGFQFQAQLGEVVDGSVEGDADVTVFGEHGLAAGFTQIEDGQAAVSEDGAGPLVKAFGVGTAAGERLHHGANAIRRGCGQCLSGEAGDATHGVGGTSKCRVNFRIAKKGEIKTL